MCGIAGIWDRGSLTSELLISVKRMAKEINIGVLILMDFGKGIMID